MDEMYRMLGREHEADLEREARTWRRADVARRLRHVPAPASTMQAACKHGQKRTCWRGPGTRPVAATVAVCLLAGLLLVVSALAQTLQ